MLAPYVLFHNGQYFSAYATAALSVAGEIPMTSDTRNPMDELPEALLEDAAIWQARLREATPDSADRHRLRAQFNQWLLADTRHRQAFAEMEALWSALEMPMEQLIDEEPSVLPQAVACRSRGHVCIPARSLAMAACLVLAVFVVFGWQQDWITRWQSDYITAVGEDASIETEDGSAISLNTDSALAMEYNARERRVRLLKGEAWFKVAASDKRPFIVSTRAGVVKVTGTQFNLRLDGDSAIVSLDEGRVELQVPDKAHAMPVILTPGQQAVLGADHISAPAPFDRTAVTAWRRGQFVFYNTPLAEVVDTLNRHRPGRILITSRELNSLKVSGIFSTDDPDAALELIASTLPIQQTRLPGDLVLIR